MSTTDRRYDRGRNQSRALLRSAGMELRTARVAVGLSQDRLAAFAGLSGSTVGRLERGELPQAKLANLAILFALLGHRLSLRPYPEGPPLRDIAHARLLSRLRSVLPGSMTMRTEVPIAVGDDLRAWDAMVGAGAPGDSDACAVEAETRLSDLQATDRRIALKMRDASVDRVILLVANTKQNRRILREFHELIRSRYPLHTRALLAALRAGRCPDQNGVLLL